MPRLMIVYYEVGFCLYLEEILSAIGYDVVGIAYTGEKAIEMGQEIHPDLILIHIVLPGSLDGIESERKVTLQLDISVKTVEYHREGIGRKLGLKERRVNLRSYLLPII